MASHFFSKVPTSRGPTSSSSERESWRDAFASHIVDDGFTGSPEITVTRLVEADDVVVAEGSVRAPRTDGTVMSLVFCDVFEMRDGKIRALTSYLMETKTAADPAI